MDLRESLFSALGGKTFFFSISSCQNGLLAGVEEMERLAEGLSLREFWVVPEGSKLAAGTVICRGRGTAQQLAQAEETFLGLIGKPSGVATSARNFVQRARGRAEIVCGGWKKVAPELRNSLRRAVALGGAGVRLTEKPFIYLDKNYVRIFGGVGPAVERGHLFPERVIAVQIRGEENGIIQESMEALRAGAGILMIDTGKLEDLKAAVAVVEDHGRKEWVQVAFAGGVTIEQLEAVIDAGAKIVDIGRSIIDAPMLDFRLDAVRGGG